MNTQQSVYIKVIFCAFFTLLSVCCYSQPSLQIWNYNNDRLETCNDTVFCDTDWSVIISWTPDSTFLPPYRYGLKTDLGSILWSKTTNNNVAVFPIEKSQQFYIESHNGNSVSCFIVENNGNRLHLDTILLIIAAIVILWLLLLLINYWFRGKIKHDKDDVNLPESVEERKGNRSKKFENVTVLFADIQGFTKIAEHMNPEQLIDELDRYFISFDEIVEKYNIEKIKTIGDAYMCAGGIPESNSANPIEVVLAAMEIMSYVKSRQASGEGFWNIRIGIHTGPVISGMLGFKKRSFDIWGDSVNIASRMESSSVAGEINITGETYNRIKDFFNCEYRGMMPVKYKGEIDMYFVKSIKPKYIDQDNAAKPNFEFVRKLQLLKYSDLERYVELQLLETASEAIKNKFKRFITRVDILSRAENLSEAEIVHTKVVALIFFAQKHVESYHNNIGDINVCMKRMHLTESEMMSIKQTVNRRFFTKKPESTTEKIIFDSEFEFVGRKDLFSLIQEQQLSRTKKMSNKDVLKKYFSIVNETQYYTQSARRLAEVSRDEQLRTFEQILRI